MKVKLHVHIKIKINFRFVARKTSWSTLAGFKELREVVTMLPPALKTLSEGTLVAQIHTNNGEPA